MCRNIQEFMDWMQAEDPVKELPQEFVMMARVSVLLRGVANAFGLKMRTAPAWAAVAEDMLKKEDPERYRSWKDRLAADSKDSVVSTVE